MKRAIWILIPALALMAALHSWRMGAWPAFEAAAVAEQPRYVALTFDDGPNRGTTDVLLDGLTERGAHATFFVIGRQIEGNEDLLLRMRDGGHQVGNHTWNHVDLSTGAAESRREIWRTDAALRQLLGEDAYWIRPPYGRIGGVLAQELDVPLVKWSVDPRDWENRNADAVARKIREGVEPGSIVILHDIYPTSVAASLAAIDALTEEGYRFVTVEELLRLNGIEPPSGRLITDAGA